MTKAGGVSGGKQCNNQPTMGAAKSGQQLMSRPPEGCGQWLLSKAAGNIIFGRTMACNDKVEG
jgi:hypothetical protein